jgi:hypothetical protein
MQNFRYTGEIDSRNPLYIMMAIVNDNVSCNQKLLLVDLKWFHHRKYVS